jgi:hypothetical protein
VRRGLGAIFAHRRANALHTQGQARSDAGDDEAALALYHRALQLEPERPETLYNIGLIHKYRQAWADSLDYNRRALALWPDDDATRWNLGIAATALSDWPTARQVWRLGGFDIGEGAGPIVRDFGPTCVRLNPDGDAEVVWATRIDPVRALITNVPYPQSGYFHGDIVLHDGASTGKKVAQDREYFIFNAFGLAERSPYGTAAAAISAPSGDDVQALLDACTQAGMPAEDWTASTVFLCRQCSEGVTHAEHDQDLEPVWVGERSIGVAVTEEDARTLRGVLDAWAAGPGRSVGDLSLTN